MPLLDRLPITLRPVPGIELLLLPEARFKRAQLALHFDRPLADGRSPARTLLGMVLEQGSRRHPSLMAVARAEEELYGAEVGWGGSRSGEAHRSTLGCSWAGEDYLPPASGVAAGVLALARELLEDPARGAGGEPFRPDVLERERTALLRRIRSMRDDRAAWARERFLQALCAGEPYATPPWGTEEEVAVLVPSALEGARRELLERAPLTVIGAGPFDPEALAGVLLPWLEGLGGERTPVPEPREKHPGSFRELREELPCDQARFHCGFRFAPPREPRSFEAISLAVSVLGGGAHGRLFRILREQRSLCYGIGAQLRTRKGIVEVAAGIDVSSYEAVLEEVRVQVEALAGGGITEEELHTARAQILNHLESLGDTPGGIMSFLEREHLLGFDRSPAQRAADLRVIEPEEIAAAAAAWEPDAAFLLAPAAPVEVSR